MTRILLLAEHAKGRLKKASLSALTVANELAATLGGSVDALVLGSGVSDVAQDLSAYGLHEVLVADAPELGHYVAETWASALAALVREGGHQIVLAASSSCTKDLLPRAAAMFRAGMASDICGLQFEGGQPLFGRPVWAGNAIAWVAIDTPIKFLTVRATEFAPAPRGAAAPIRSVTPPLAGNVGAKWVRFDETRSERPELTEARVVVSVGRGCKGADGVALVSQLADALGAAVGASRAAVDAGWVPNDLQVGQTGKIVAPDLYIAAGLSGAIQHLAGMKGSKIIVAINKDEEAPIFQVADYGLVGDLFKVLPELTAAVKAQR